MKYIIDIDALKDCFDLLPKPFKYNNGDVFVNLNDIKEMIDKFPKEEYGHEYKETLNVWSDCSVEMNQTNKDILKDIRSGKGLSKI